MTDNLKNTPLANYLRLIGMSTKDIRSIFLELSGKTLEECLMHLTSKDRGFDWDKHKHFLNLQKLLKMSKIKKPGPAKEEPKVKKEKKPKKPKKAKKAKKES